MTDGHVHQGPKWGLSSRVVMWGALAIIAFFLYTEHRAHLYGALPFLLLSLCPLMHLFHGGHGGHGGHGDEEPRRDESRRSEGI